MAKKKKPRKPISEEHLARLRANASKGGQATAAKRATDPDYYRRIGAEGGRSGAGKTRPKKAVTSRTKIIAASTAPAQKTLDAILKELGG